MNIIVKNGVRLEKNGIKIHIIKKIEKYKEYKKKYKIIITHIKTKGETIKAYLKLIENLVGDGWKIKGCNNEFITLEE